MDNFLGWFAEFMVLTSLQCNYAKRQYCVFDQGMVDTKEYLVRALQIIALTKDCRPRTLMHEMAESSLPCLPAFLASLFIYLSLSTGCYAIFTDSERR